MLHLFLSVLLKLMSKWYLSHYCIDLKIIFTSLIIFVHDLRCTYTFKHYVTKKTSKTYIIERIFRSCRFYFTAELKLPLDFNHARIVHTITYPLFFGGFDSKKSKQEDKASYLYLEKNFQNLFVYYLEIIISVQQGYS